MTLITAREQEIERLCEAAGIQVQATAMTAKSVICTVKPIQSSRWHSVLTKLTRAMNDQDALYAVEQIAIPGAPIKALRFEELP